VKRNVKREGVGKQQVFRGSIRKYKPLVGAGPAPTGPVPFESMFSSSTTSADRVAHGCTYNVPRGTFCAGIIVRIFMYVL